MSRKPGDWDCPSCGDLQFAKNASCRKCGTPNPDPEKSSRDMAAGIRAGFGGATPKQGDWFCPSCGDLQFAKNPACRKCATPNPNGGMMGMMSFGGAGSLSMAHMKQGDWNCPKCGDHQFARNSLCRKCGAERPAGTAKPKTKPGDWFCPKCEDLNFAKNDICRKCGEPNPDPEGSLAAMEAGITSGFGGAEEKPGDWYCPSCGDLQFAKNMECRKCSTPNPDPAASKAALANLPGGNNAVTKKPGDWHCSSCGDLQFAKNMSCRKCGTPNYAAMAQSMFGGGKPGKGGFAGSPGCKGGFASSPGGKGGFANSPGGKGKGAWGGKNGMGGKGDAMVAGMLEMMKAMSGKPSSKSGASWGEGQKRKWGDNFYDDEIWW